MYSSAYFRGISIGAALRAASYRGTMESVSSLKYEASSVWGYVEVLAGPLITLELSVAYSSNINSD